MLATGKEISKINNICPILDSDASRKHNVVRFSRRYALRRDTPSTGCTSTASGEPHAGGRPEILGEAKYFVHGWAERSEVQESGPDQSVPWILA